MPKMYGAHVKLKLVVLRAVFRGLFTEHISFIHVAFLRKVDLAHLLSQDQ